MLVLFLIYTCDIHFGKTLIFWVSLEKFDSLWIIHLWSILQKARSFAVLDTIYLTLRFDTFLYWFTHYRNNINCNNLCNCVIWETFTQCIGYFIFDNRNPSQSRARRIFFTPKVRRSRRLFTRSRSPLAKGIMCEGYFYSKITSDRSMFL